MSEIEKIGSDTPAKAIANFVLQLAGGSEKVLSKVLNKWFKTGQRVWHRLNVTGKWLIYRIICWTNLLETNLMMCIAVVECIEIRTGIFGRQFFKFSNVILDNLRVQT